MNNSFMHWNIQFERHNFLLLLPKRFTRACMFIVWLTCRKFAISSLTCQSTAQFRLTSNSIHFVMVLLKNKLHTNLHFYSLCHSTVLKLVLAILSFTCEWMCILCTKIYRISLEHLTIIANKKKSRKKCSQLELFFGEGVDFGMPNSKSSNILCYVAKKIIEFNFLHHYLHEIFYFCNKPLSSKTKSSILLFTV